MDARQREMDARQREMDVQQRDMDARQREHNTHRQEQEMQQRERDLEAQERDLANRERVIAETYVNGRGGDGDGDRTLRDPQSFQRTSSDALRVRKYRACLEFLACKSRCGDCCR